MTNRFRLLPLVVLLVLTACGSQEQLIWDEDVSGIEERLPEMIGGQHAFYNRLVYPDEARRDNIQGTVILRFTVNENGYPDDITVERGVHHSLNRAAVDAMRSMRFIPGVQNGKRVSVEMTFPVGFRLM